MKSNPSRYLFLQLYDDAELCAFLSSMQRRGYLLQQVKGNRMHFVPKNPEDKRLHITTSESMRQEVDQDILIRSKQLEMEALGWALLCVGPYENTLPARRRLYLATSDPEAAVPQEELEDNHSLKAIQTTLAWALMWVLFLILALYSGLTRGLSLGLVIMDLSLLVLSCCTLVMHMNRKNRVHDLNEGTDDPAASFSALRKAEAVMLCAMVFLFLGAMGMLLG